MGLRLATLADAEALAQLHKACFAQGWTARSLAEFLASPGAFALLAEDNDIPQGFVLAREAGGEAEILTIAVRPEARRRGLGRALVQAAATKAEQMGAAILFLEVAVDNEPALRLYETLGFAQAGRRQAYYARKDGPSADALTLKAELPLASSGVSSCLGNGA